MPRVRMTQAFVDRLTSGNQPVKDTIFWDGRMPGFGISHKTGSGIASFCIQWRERDTGVGHRLVLARASRVSLAAAREIARTRFAEIAGGRNPIAERKTARAVPLFAEFIDGYFKSAAWASKAPSTKRSDRSRIDRYLLQPWAGCG